MDGDLQKYLKRSAAVIEETLAETASSPEKPTQKASLSQAKKATKLLTKCKDNIAWVLALTYQVAQLEEAVADLKSENDLLGGGTKNFSIDMSGAPGGSATVIITAACIVVFIGFLIWYQNKRKKQ